MHYLQTKAELVTAPSPLGTILREFHRDKLTLRERHVAVARLVGDYNFNNTYQYVIAREDVHLSWLEAALLELGETPDTVTPPSIAPLGKKGSFVPFVADDARDAAGFVSRWRPRLAGVNNARHRSMMEVVLGETLEQKRFFDQMLEGREDLLGRRANGPGPVGTGDGVLPVRWIE